MRLIDRAGISRKSGEGLAATDARPARSAQLLLSYEPDEDWIEEHTRIAVSRNVNVSGHLVFQEAIRIEGRFRGDISSSELIVISRAGVVDGGIRTPRALILGKLQGAVIGSQSVVLGPHACVNGRIETESLTVCEGARLDADIRVAAQKRSAGSA
jgi:cytoskeletal protein CcmA (bactofilin family)